VTLEVERVDASSSEGLAARLESGERPLIIAGGAAQWRAVSNWTPAYLEQLLGTVELDYKVSSSNAHPDFRQAEPKDMFARGRGSLGELLRKLSAGPEADRARFLFTGDEQFLLRRRDGITTRNPLLEPLLLDVEIPELFSEQQLYTVWSWFSGRGVRTWLHYDNNGCHNLNAQITGHKQCWLYAPDELPRLHPFLLGGTNPAYNCSQIDVERPQPEFVADLRAARSWHAELAAGDLLFIPAWWFHTFTHHGEFNANVNFWWKPLRAPWNLVAARQALLDTAARATFTDRAQAAPILHTLDAAACGICAPTPPSKS
jgi:Cupin-like domain